MHDALAFGHEREKRGRTELAHVVVERGDLRFAHWVGDAVITQFPAGGRCVVIGRGHHRTDSPNGTVGDTQSFIGLRAGDLVHQMAVDVQNRGAVFFGVDHMLVPNFVVQGASHVINLRGVGCQRLAKGGTSRLAAPVNNWRGRPILYSGSLIISLSWAIQPTVRASAKIPVNKLTGMPIARCTMPE